MWPYFILPVLTLWPALKEKGLVSKKSGGTWWIIVCMVMLLQVGWRHEVGGDWFNYLDHIDTAQTMSFTEVFTEKDPAYVFLNWLGANVWGGMYLPNMVCAWIFSLGLVRFCRHSKRPWLMLSIATPYLVTVVAMGYTRQAVAIGLAMMAMSAILHQGSFARFIVWIGLAAVFHKSAVILVPLALLAGSNKRWVSVLGVGLAAPLLFLLLLQESVETLVSGYIEAEYASSGAGIRVAMNALPAAFFLVFRKHFPQSDEQKNFWTWMSLGALAFIALLAVSPSSTAVDRVALYWIPLQLFVWSHFPEVMSKFIKNNALWVSLMLFYNLAILFVWLTFGQNAFTWLPYRFYPLVWLFA